jgi:hypothetical protein
MGLLRLSAVEASPPIADYTDRARRERQARQARVRMSKRDRSTSGSHLKGFKWATADAGCSAAPAS